MFLEKKVKDTIKLSSTWMHQYEHLTTPLKKIKV